MTIEDGAKLIVSAGLVAPEYKRKVVTTDGKPLEVGLANPTWKRRELKFSGGSRTSQPARRSRTASSRPKR